MLINKKITMLCDSTLDDIKIASFGAVLNTDTMDLTMTSRYINKDLCKLHRDLVRSDQAEFEDFAYTVQDALKSVNG